MENTPLRKPSESREVLNFCAKVENIRRVNLLNFAVTSVIQWGRGSSAGAKCGAKKAQKSGHQNQNQSQEEEVDGRANLSSVPRKWASAEGRGRGI